MSALLIARRAEIDLEASKNAAAEDEALVPFLKWAGGKRWLVREYASLFPKEFESYYEPFLGSGSTFFALNPAKAILSDANDCLIECFSALKSNYARVITHLRKHAAAHSSRHYYRTREQKYRTAHSRAAALIYLNRVCWNGLYRVNRRGQFNVPIGTKTTVLLPSDNFPIIAQRLKSARLIAGDFEKTIAMAKKGDFVFADPPYTVKHNNNGFIKYNESLFVWSDQVRLKSAFDAATKRGALMMLCNADHSSIRELYNGSGKIRRVRRHSVLSGDASFRGQTSEVVITNY